MKHSLPHLKRAAVFGSTALALLVGASMSTTALSAPPEGKGGVPARQEAPGHIVVFKKNVNAPAAANELESKNGLKIGRVYSHAIKGVFVPTDLPPQALEALKRNPNVAYVEKNGVCWASSQSIPTGIDRADVEFAVEIDGIDDLVDVDIAIIDTGINPIHPDLNVNHSMSVGYYYSIEGHGRKQRQVLNESNDVTYWADEYGHGTHVAGIAGAIDNEIGVVGVAPGARLASVRVLDETANTTWAILLAGMDYVAAHADTFEVANMSIQTNPSSSMTDAVANMTAAGVVVVVAAGNFSDDASNWSPSSAPSAITVSALADTDGLPGGLGPESFRADGTSRGADDTLATFSNYGALIDVAAPGVEIYSTDLNGGYSVKSGTSMATPYVAGAVALYIALNGRDRDGNGVIDGNDVALMESLVKSTGWQLGDYEYFTGDPDPFPEPLLNVPNLLGYQIDLFPTVSLTSPSDGAVVAGIVSLEADTSDDYAVTQVEFFVGGASVGVDSDSADGYSAAWNSTLVSDETYEISAVATDDALQTSSSTILVSVDNVDSLPAADAGSDQTVQDADASGDEWVTLDGSGSSDDRGISSYEWYEGSLHLATGMSPSVELSVGAHTITLVVFDSIGQTSPDSVVITVEEAPPAGAQASVASVVFTGYGGKNGNNHLQAAASIENDLGAAVAGAIVEAELYHDGSMIGSSTSTTDGSGSALLFDEKSVASGDYHVVITNVTAADLTFDGVTPDNQYIK